MAHGATTISSGRFDNSGVDEAGVEEVDGGPPHLACTGNFGGALSPGHGRMDGILVAVLPPGAPHRCNGDLNHVHLQVQIHGEVYDVAVNVDGLHAEVDAALPGGAWEEGWHPGTDLDYPTSLGLHASAFAATTPETLAQQIEQALVTGRPISVFTTSYGPGGAHDVHRRGNGQDGAIVIDPLAPAAHLLLFSFPENSF
jgi:hypothetical protein